MKAFIVIITLFFISCQTKGQSEVMMFDINKDMIGSFNPEKFEIQLSKDGEKKCENIDFSKYNYVAIKGFSEKIPLVNSAMSFRPPNVFIYLTKGKLCTDKGLLRLQVNHLDAGDKRLVEIKQALR